MAVKYDEAEILRGGVKYDRPSKGSFALNLVRRHGAWEVRQGFGQLSQFDCMVTNDHAFAGSSWPPPKEWGYEKHFGSHSIVTDFGHEQIISVFSAKVYSSDIAYSAAEVLTVYVVSIFDLTTRERWEEPLYRHTCDGDVPQSTTKAGSLARRHGQYETNQNIDYQAWIPVSDTGAFVFAELGDTVYFGSSGTPIYAYSPCTFRGNRRRFVSGSHAHPWAPPYSESSMIWRLKASPGAFSDVYVYLDESGLPSPQAMASFQGRLVVAGNGREVFFSQVDDPSAFIDFDFITVPTERKITALASMGQTLYIFTETETFVYQPASRGGEPVASQGMTPVRISETVGCVSQSCVAKEAGAAIWLSRRGVHVSDGGLEITTISDNIAPLFTDFITDPVTTFFTSVTSKSGSTDLNSDETQRNSVYTLKTSMANVCYSSHLDAVLVTLPDERISLCYSSGEWSVWTYESNTKQFANSDPYISDKHMPGAYTNIAAPWLVSAGEGLYLVGSVEDMGIQDSASYGATSPVLNNTVSRSAYLLEYGRGGAIDRSVSDEDHRVVAGKYEIVVAGSAPTGEVSEFIIGEWIPVEQKYPFPNAAGANAMSPTAGYTRAPVAPDLTFLVPFYIVPDMLFDYSAANKRIQKVKFDFRFDAARWTPVLKSGTTEVDIIVPSERMQSAGSPFSAALGGQNVYNVAVDATRITLEWSGTTSKSLNTPPLHKCLMCYVPMMYTATSKDTSASNMGITWVTAGSPPSALCVITDESGGVHQVGINKIWSQTYLGLNHVIQENRTGSPAFDPDGNPIGRGENIAQAVDWAYMSEDVGLPEDARIKGRGLSVRLLSHGEGDESVTTWAQGLFNVLMVADMKTWMAQWRDYVQVALTATSKGLRSVFASIYPTRLDTPTIRSRTNITGAGTNQRVEFGSGLKYGNSAVESYGVDDCTIGDEQVDEITTSSSAKGNSVSTMLFGYMRNPAERVRLESVKFLFRVVGKARRRHGR